MIVGVVAVVVVKIVVEYLSVVVVTAPSTIICKNMLQYTGIYTIKFCMLFFGCRLIFFDFR